MRRPSKLWTALLVVTSALYFARARTQLNFTLEPEEIHSQINQISLENQLESEPDFFLAKCKPNTRLPSGWCVEEKAEKWRYVNQTHRRRTLKGTKKCLANKHVVLIGDSRTRFQYLALVAALVKGAYPQCHEHLAKNSSDCHLQGRGVGKWNKYLVSTNAELNLVGQVELCHCYKGNSDATMRENRYFALSTQFGPIHVSYFNTISNSLTLEKHFPPFSNYSDRPERCQPGTCRLTPDEVGPMSVSDVLLKIVPVFNPKVTHVFAAGGWKTFDIGCNITQLSRDHGVKAWYQSAPKPNGMFEMFDWPEPPQGCNPPLFDRTTMTLEPPPWSYRDSAHPYSSMNEEFNMFMLDVICGSKDDS